MARKSGVRITFNFEQNLEAIRRFLTGNEAPHAFDDLIVHLFDTVIPNLERFPEMGVEFMRRLPLSLEGRTAQEDVSKRLGNAALREYIFQEYLILYAVRDDKIYLLALKHHRQLCFDLKSFWL